MSWLMKDVREQYLPIVNGGPADGSIYGLLTLPLRLKRLLGMTPVWLALLSPQGAMKVMADFARNSGRSKFRRIN